MVASDDVRAATLADGNAIVAIYNQGIRGRSATFETRERTTDDIQSWFGVPHHPLLVAEINGVVLGWIHVSDYRPRECYAGIGEFSVYVADSAQGCGIGSALMAAFLPACEQAGLWKILSRIFVENTGSRALCQRFGFREVGIYEKHAQLDGVWKDVVIVERLLPTNLT